MESEAVCRLLGKEYKMLIFVVQIDNVLECINRKGNEKD